MIKPDRAFEQIPNVIIPPIFAKEIVMCVCLWTRSYCVSRTNAMLRFLLFLKCPTARIAVSRDLRKYNVRRTGICAVTAVICSNFSGTSDPEGMRVIKTRFRVIRTAYIIHLGRFPTPLARHTIALLHLLVPVVKTSFPHSPPPPRPAPTL